MVYPNYEPPYSRLRYTGVVQDMIDGAKSVTSDYYFTEANPWVRLRRTYSDQVSGYTIKQIENVLHKTKTWDEWRMYIFNDYPSNSSRNNLNATFNFWNIK